MKKLVILLVGLLIANVVMAQQPQIIDFDINTVTQYGPNNLYFCDSVTKVIVHKNPDYSGTPFWIDQYDNVVHADSIILTAANDGKLVYIEKDNDLLLSVIIRIVGNEMPAVLYDTMWLHEDLMYNVEPITLRPTEEDFGYFYVWESSNWSSDSTYQGYELEVGNAGHYTCHMYDECLHHSQKEIFVEKAPVIEYVSTNLNLNLNELHWTPKGSVYDTIAICRNGNVVTICNKLDGVWVDPMFNNEVGTPWYTMYAMKNGRIIDESVSRWKTGISLELQNETAESVDLSFYGPDNEIGYPLGGYVQFFQLYSVENTGFGLVRSMIPVGTTELLDIENDYDTLVLAAVLWDGIEVFSNMVFPNGSGSQMLINERCQENIQFYPNPTTGILNISGFINSEYKIFDLQGRAVMSGRLEQRLDVSSLAKGIYTIAIKEGQQSFTRKFILK